MLHRDKAALLLIACAIIFAHPAIGGKRKRCTDEDKNNVLTHCHDYARYGSGIYPHKISPCCVVVREVPGRDMECIIDLLTTVEKNIYDVHSIREYHRICDDTPAPSWWERIRTTLFRTRITSSCTVGNTLGMALQYLHTETVTVAWQCERCRATK
ncbi:hypothetical protein HU200_029308 [Digitaria exilis]|uniref:Uncharacterized protein n=1 Tax=Digitaria exilis TaxID=1010633 RepID=A0A835C252_9POAL|nr:hypothetical protein HU200_029308 [Digitaria exilis]